MSDLVPVKKLAVWVPVTQEWLDEVAWWEQFWDDVLAGKIEFPTPPKFILPPGRLAGSVHRAKRSK